MKTSSFYLNGQAQMKAATALKCPRFGFVESKQGIMIYGERSDYEDRIVPKTYVNVAQAEKAAKKVSELHKVDAFVFGNHPYKVGYNPA